MTNSALPPLAFGFTNPWMLWWLAVAAAPLLMHLWTRRRYNETSWAAMAFLAAAMRSQARRIRIRQWILLAVRMLVIAMLVLAMAEPFFKRLGLPPAPGKRTHRVLVIDGSFSMAFRQADGSRFARAKRLAARIVEESRQGDGFTLVLMAAQPRVIVGAPAFAPGDFLREIEDLSLPHAGAELPAALAAVHRIIRRAMREHPELECNEVYFLTDLGRTSWFFDEGDVRPTGTPTGRGPARLPLPSAVGPSATPSMPSVAGASESTGRPHRAAAYRAQVTELADLATLVVLDVGQADGENLAITDLSTPDAFAIVSRDAVIDVTVRSFGRQAVSGSEVELWVDGVRGDRASVDIPAGGEASVRFGHHFREAGSHAVEARLAADRLDIDNHRWMSVPVRSFVRVLCVGGKPGSTRYLALALDPEQSASGPVRTDVISDSALMETDLDAYDVVFLSNVGQFADDEARLLDSYARRGGGLVFFLGDQVMANRYNRALTGQSADGVKVLPARLGDVVSEAQFGLDPLAYRHPLVGAFRGRERSGLLTTPVYRYFRLTIPAGWKESRVVLAFRNGDPAIVEGVVHRGRSIVVATAASLASVDTASRTPWTIMPVWPSFLPVVHEMMAYSIGSERDRYNLLVGEPLGTSRSRSAGVAFVTIDTPGGNRARQRIETHGEDTGWTFDDTDRSGIYTARVPAPDPERVHFAVNVDTAESDLSRIDHSILPRQFVVRTDWQDAGARPPGRIRRRRGWHEWLLFAAVGLLLAETSLAWWFGREMARPSTRFQETGRSAHEW